MADGALRLTCLVVPIFCWMRLPLPLEWNETNIGGDGLSFRLELHQHNFGVSTATKLAHVRTRAFMACTGTVGPDRYSHGHACCCIARPFAGMQEQKIPSHGWVNMFEAVGPDYRLAFFARWFGMTAALSPLGCLRPSNSVRRH